MDLNIIAHLMLEEGVGSPSRAQLTTTVTLTILTARHHLHIAHSSNHEMLSAVTTLTNYANINSLFSLK